MDGEKNKENHCAMQSRLTWEEDSSLPFTFIFTRLRGSTVCAKNLHVFFGCFFLPLIFGLQVPVALLRLKQVHRWLCMNLLNLSWDYLFKT